MPEPMWRWCAMPGASRDTKLNVDINAYGDGYVHRSTRGLNPARPSWKIDVPFTSAGEYSEMDTFLRTNAASGFYFEPPDGGGAVVLVTVDDWSASVADRHGERSSGEIVGTLSATFEQAFNPQPISPVVLATVPPAMSLPLMAAPITMPPPVVVVAAEPPPTDPEGVILPSPTTPLPSSDLPRQPTGPTR